MFDICGNIKEPPVSEPLEVQMTGGKSDGREKSKPQRMGMQVPYRMDTEMQTETAVWSDSQAPWEIFHELAKHKESRIEEGLLCPDHVHMLIAIPPKYAVAQVVGYIKGKSAIARNHCVRKKNYAGESFWARDYYVSTVGRDEEAIGDT